MAKRIQSGEPVPYPDYWCTLPENESPIDEAKAELAATTARRFRDMADLFRDPPLKQPGDWLEFLETHLEKCGEWLIEARKSELIEEKHYKLLELIDWHDRTVTKLDASESHLEDEQSPRDLFFNFAGIGYMAAVVVDTDASGNKVERPFGKPTGGLMSKEKKGHHTLTNFERCAAACEYVALLIDERAIAESRPLDRKYRVDVPPVYGRSGCVWVDGFPHRVSRSQWAVLKFLSDRRRTGPTVRKDDLNDINYFDNSFADGEKLRKVEVADGLRTLKRLIDFFPVPWKEVIVMSGTDRQGYRLL